MEPNIERSARLAIEQHGDRAQEHARNAAQKLLQAGQVRASMEWTNILTRIIELQQAR